ncbi:Peptidase M12B domain-containing protein [Sulfidibacter corallicola]|uniref:Peptidase M12B domain-containing protein n=1 Tax=Sulfidibacter corallicola TaxID=2818388 RepID=A0A8A4TJB3_SULCO|nr:M12 family metallo-peptidase [Sulfidibacter corallicola]QTD49284.1 hypothetical protein J3U87_27170 [Sulfidibacter corallicola]
MILSLLLAMAIQGWDAPRSPVEPHSLAFSYHSPAQKSLPAQLKAFPTPDGTVDLALQSFDIWQQEGVVVEYRSEGIRRHKPSRDRQYYRAVTKQGRLIFLAGNAAEGYRGFAETKAGVQRLTWRQDSVRYTTQINRGFECRAAATGFKFPEMSKSPRKSDDGQITVIDLAIETDNFLYREMGSTEALVEVISLSFAAVSAIYERDLGAALRLTHVAVYPEAHPWNTFTLYELQDHWQDPNNGKQHIARTLTHLLTPIGGYGQGFIDTLCDSTWGFGRSAFFGTILEDGDLSDVSLLAHELGHNLGSPHTHDYLPAIDRCPTYTGDAPADGGTIMSYCYFQTAIPETFSFHPRVQELLRDRIAAAACTAGTESAIAFEDPNFKLAILAQADANDDGEISLDEAASVTDIDVSGQQIESIAPLRHFVNLEGLIATDNGITRLPEALPATLLRLNLAGNPLSTENCTLLASLRHQTWETFELGEGFSCDQDRLQFADPNLTAALAAHDTDGDGHLSRLEASAISSLDLTERDIEDLSGLDQLKNLRSLDVSRNRLTRLARLPLSLIDVTATDNQLENIDEIVRLHQLSYLDVSGNRLTGLPQIDHLFFLETLIADDNQLTELPSLIAESLGLSRLSLADNQLTELPELPKLLFFLDVSGNELTELPYVAPVNYQDAQLLFFENNRIGTDSCDLLTEYVERDLSSLSYLPQKEGVTFDCLATPSRPPIIQSLPWIVNNGSFKSQVAIWNKASETRTVRLRGVVRQREAWTTVTLEPNSRTLFAPEDLFGNATRYSLYLHGFHKDLTMTAHLDNLRGPSAGTHAASHAATYATMTNKVTFVGLTSMSPVVLTLPGATFEAPVPLSLELFGAEGRIGDAVSVTPQGAAPYVAQLEKLFPESVGQADLTLLARAPSGNRLCGTQYHFQGWAEMAMAEATPFLYNSTIRFFPVGNDLKSVRLNLFNAGESDGGIFLLAYGADGARANAGFQVKAKGTLTIDPSEHFDGDQPTSLLAFGSAATFGSIMLQDQVGSGDASPAMMPLPRLTSSLSTIEFHDLAESAQTLLYLAAFRPTDVTLHLYDLNHQEIAQETWTVPEGGNATWVGDLGEVFPGVDLEDKYLVVQNGRGQPMVGYLRHVNEEGRSSLLGSLPK